MSGPARSNPVAVDGLEVVPTADGYVVYDESHDRVHYLNHTAALVLEFCTGDNSARDIIRMLQLSYDLPRPPERETRDCLESLQEQGLLR